MSRADFEAAAAGVATALGRRRTKDLAGLLAQGRDADHIVQAMNVPALHTALRTLLDVAARDGVSGAESAAYLRGYTAGWSDHHGETEVRTVWSGPHSAYVPVRPTAQVLSEVVREAAHTLVAMTYAARAYPALTGALRDADRRGVRVDIVVETLDGASGLLGGREPADAFAAVPGVRLWHWPLSRRQAAGARQHAKIAVADDRLLFIGSANLTASAATRNIEAGVLVRGGSAPQRAAEHIRELQRTGVLRRLAR